MPKRKPRASKDYVAGTLDLTNEALIKLMTRVSEILHRVLY